MQGDQARGVLLGAPFSREGNPKVVHPSGDPQEVLPLEVLRGACQAVCNRHHKAPGQVQQAAHPQTLAFLVQPQLQGRFLGHWVPEGQQSDSQEDLVYGPCPLEARDQALMQHL